MEKKRGRPQREEAPRDKVLGVNVSEQTLRRLNWIAAEEKLSKAEWLTRQINDRAESLANEKALIQKARSIRDLVKSRWLEILDSGVLPLEVMVEIRDGRIATDEEVVLLAGSLGLEEELLLSLERNGNGGVVKPNSR